MLPCHMGYTNNDIFRFYHCFIVFLLLMFHEFGEKIRLYWQAVQTVNSDSHNTVLQSPQAITLLFQKNLKMPESTSKKCTFLNSGYCKFTNKDNDCKYIHPATSCSIKNAKTKDALSAIQKIVDMFISADIGQNAFIGMH